MKKRSFWALGLLSIIVSIAIMGIAVSGNNTGRAEIGLNQIADWPDFRMPFEIGSSAPTEKVFAPALPLPAAPKKNALAQEYDHEDTRQLVALVKDAAGQVRTKGEKAFEEFRVPGSRWRKGESYIFVLDQEGNMLVHPEPDLEGKNQLELKNINNKFVVRGLIEAATRRPDKPEGWYHYQWPVPGGLTPRWKSSFVRLVKVPSGKSYIVGSGMYNDRMEKEFVVELVQHAVAEIEKKGEAAYPLFRDPKGPFLVKDAYLLVIDKNGVELVNPAFPGYEGQNVLDLKDSHGKLLVREMLKVVQEKGAGWVTYMWPKPGESVPTQKSTYVSKARLGDNWVLVGCGVYLQDAPKAAATARTMSAPELMALVREAAGMLEKQGEKAYPEFRKKGSKWFRDQTYFFVWTLDGTRVFHAAKPEGEGKNEKDLKDPLGRPVGRMFLEVGASSAGEGWVHYMWPEPGKFFPVWKSSFLKRVTFPSGKQHLVGCGIYDMQMDKAFIEDLVNRAASLVEKQGKQAFSQLRDKTGPYVFMDTYVFVDTPEGEQLVNAAQPSLEGKNLMNEKDQKGKLFVQEYQQLAMQKGSGWTDHYWYKPGQENPARKSVFVKKVQAGGETFILGAGYFPEQTGSQAKTENNQKPEKKAKK